MSNTEQIAKGMDISARSIDLLTALTETANNPQGIVQLGLEVGRWLGRERLSESQLQRCLESARGLALANSKGYEFYEAVTSGTRELAIRPLFSQHSGSVGRLMAKDPYLCWIISTVACLFEFHTSAFISDVLCAFIMQANLAGSTVTEAQLAWHPLRLQLKPVIDKIVSSILFNIVNSGVVKPGQPGNLSTLPLPPEIQAICPRGHNLDSHRLGVVLGQLRNIQGEIVIESKNIVTNLTIWLIYHFKGRFRVVVSGKVVYNEVLGPDESTIEHRTECFCQLNHPCDSEKTKPVVIILLVQTGGLKEIFRGQYDTQMTMHENPCVRQKLYSSVKYPHGSTGKESFRVRVRQTAIEIVSWLLSLRLRRDANGIELKFNIVFDCEEDHLEELRVSHLLSRVPAILNMGWRDTSAKTQVFTNIELSERTRSPVSTHHDSDFDLNPNDEPESMFSEPIPGLPGLHLGFFPILQDLLDDIRHNCRCYDCQRPSSLVTRVSSLKPGCLQHTAFMEVMQYVAHSISDGFGAEDCSAAATRHIEDLGVIQVLKEAARGSIRWRTWFNTAVQVVLGSPSINELTDSPAEDYKQNDEFVWSAVSSTVVAVQHGNLAVVAPWLDLSLPLRAENCFAFKIVQGRLGLLKEDGAQFEGLQGDSAVIETRYSEDVQNYSNTFPLPEVELGSHVSLHTDNCNAASNFMMVPYGSNRYILMMRVISESHSRFIDMARAMIKASQPVQTISCNHSITDIAEVRPTNPRLKVYAFDDLLGRWPDETINPGQSERPEQRQDMNGEVVNSEEGTGAHVHSHVATAMGSGTANSKASPVLRVSQVLDTFLKYNIALALVHDSETILNHEQVCLTCLLDNGVSLKHVNGIASAAGDKWVICRSRNVEASMPVNPSRSARKRIKGGV